MPYRHRPIQPTYGDGSQWFNWLTEDQRFVTDRKDVAVWKLPVLKKDLVVTGEVMADIFASTTGTDNDMVVKLIDQYPDDDSRPEDARLPVDDQRGDLPRTLSGPLRPGAPAARRMQSANTASACTTWITSSRPDTR